MNVVLVYLRLYADAFVTTFKAIAKSPWTLLLPMGLAVAFGFLASLLGPLGLVGGFILGLIESAAFSAYLYFVGEVVSRSTTSVRELRKGLGVYFWSVISVQFVLMVADWFLEAATNGTPKQAALLAAVWLLKLVALNAAPETIYVKGTRSGMDTIMASFQFLQENWIEWFIPNGPAIAGAWAVVTYGRSALAGLPGMVGMVALPLMGGAVFHVVMVFRGLLYLALDGTSHRQRLYKYRTGA